MEINKDILTFGEIMLRFSPPDHEKLIQARTYDLNIGGAEANVVVSLALLGNKVKYISRLPNNDIGDLVIQELKKQNINTDGIIRGGDRIGIYYLEKGSSVRPSKVVYDRKHSAFSEISLNMFDWDQLFENVKWFHVTGITPALSRSCEEVYLHALKVAKSKNITISFDINYRSNLWTIDAAKKIIQETLGYTDVLFANKGVAEELFNIKSDAKSTDAVGTFSEVAEKLSSICKSKYIAFTHRNAISASSNTWQGVMFEKNQGVCSRAYTIDVVDRIGAGDAFAAGIIHGLTNRYDNQRTIDFATAASAIKHTIKGGVTLENAGDWIKAGANAVGIGSTLINDEIIFDKDYSKLKRNTKKVMASLNI